MSAKTPIAFVAGAVIGAAGTWVLSAKYFNNKLENDIQAIKADFSNEVERLNAEINDQQETIAGLVAGNAVKETEEPKFKKKVKKVEEKPDLKDLADNITDYTSFSKKDKEPKPEPDVDIPTKVKKDAKKDPYVIDRDEFFEPDNNNIKVYLRYFNNDNLFLNEDGEIDNTGFKTVGKRNVNFLVNESEGEIFIRNEVMGIDIDLVLEQMPYQDYIGEVYGTEEEEEDED